MIKVLICEPSYLVRKGLISVLNELKGGIDIKETASTDDIIETIGDTAPNIFIINTSISSILNMEQLLKDSNDEIEVVSVFNSPLNLDSSNTQISIFDSKSTLLNKLGEIIKSIDIHNEQETASEELSDREKDVLREIALGKTNKEIATNLYISTHTVISHRKNITRKLGIKTVSGLTVYSILNQIISVEDIS
ncbi:response regulator transcription factor [Saccharicrinis aurantiacus]|uniref:response regulator transcription factor n=1 Tax=Saccharicrinis aurantiacus TaxID=1849719 RepID=UPI00094FD57C|nr:LuxR C-terminal-related transcriptional regulator [Saccharicrinis aurantiacus]